jgi:hypothetical protein
MAVVVFDEFDRAGKQPSELGDLRTVRLDAPGELLDAGYRLLEHVFDPAVLDAKSTYVELLSPGGLQLDGFKLLCLAGLFECDGANVMAGMAAGNLMWIDRETRTLQLAIGNIATSPGLKAAGFRGVGSTLLAAAFDFAQAEASSQGGEVAYSVAEAEPESLGFWTKRGYLWPRGVEYLQPPLEFEEDGRRIYDEVPETLLVRPLGASDPQSIDADVLRKIVLGIYRNWAIETNRSLLSAEAIAAAEAYVMNDVFPKVDATIPRHGRVPLTNP